MSRAKERHGARPRKAILLVCEQCRIWTRYKLIDAPPDSEGRQTYRCAGCGREVRR